MSEKQNNIPSMEDWKKKRMEELKDNQKRVHGLVSLLGQDIFHKLAEHLGSDEENFDPDEKCGSRSCRHCGACGSMDRIDFIEVKDPFTGEQATQNDLDEVILKKWKISCNICGETWEEFLREVD
jgi:hypothetical protein